ncbi:O-antigen ligase family protein [Natronorarus salvus]|uniref:O-antigen ligase family protein n=1 Tax=Natronorarus salvus TaxID=3117733 RepID=UPI002F26A12A
MSDLPVRLRPLASFEVLFVCFLFSGVFKAWAPLAWVPVDLTALLATLTALSGGWLLVRGFRPHRTGVVLSLLFGLFAGYAALSLRWSPSGLYAGSKAFRLLTVTALSLVGAALVVSASRARLRRAFATAGVLAAVATVETIRVGLSPGLPTPFGTNYLIVGRLIGFGAVLIAAVLLFDRPELRYRVAGWTALGGCLLALLLAGGRGPLTSTVVVVAGLAVVALVTGHASVPRDGRVVAAGVGGVALLGGVLLAVGEAIRGVRRFLLLLDGPGDSLGGRFAHYETAVDLWLSGSTLRGHGLGGWSVLVGDADVQSYPHNLVLEILVELGVVGLALFALLVCAGVVALARGWVETGDPTSFAVAALFSFTFLNAAVTGDLNENRFLFAAIGLLAYRPVDRIGPGTAPVAGNRPHAANPGVKR